MRLFIDQPSDNTLLRKLVPYWQGVGVRIVEPPQIIDVQLGSAYFSKFGPVKRRVLRLDGIYYDTEDTDLRDSINNLIRQSYGWANTVIFQSKFSERLCVPRLLGLGDKRSTVILNGAEEWGPRKAHTGFNIVCTGVWRRWKRLPEMIKIMAKMEGVLHVVGADVGSTPFPNIIYHGELNFEEMRELYQTMDVALHLAKRDACPNTVSEFIMSGIPVIVSDKGGGAVELAKLSPECIIVAGDHDPGEIDDVPLYSEEWNALPRDFEEGVIFALEMIRRSRPEATKPIELTLSYVASKYLDILEFIW